MDCPFCGIVARISAGEAIAVEVTRRWSDAVAIRPRSGGVHPGHVLVIPHVHVADIGVDPAVTGAVMARAAELAAGLADVNLISSKGRYATQSVDHLHVHVVPRAEGDGLPLPWTPQHAARAAVRAAVEAELRVEAVPE